MGSVFSKRKLEVNQPGMQGVSNLENFAAHQSLGKAGKQAKGLMREMGSGDYSGIAGSMLAPIHDQYAAQGREQERNALMGANAMYAGSQPALMAGLQNESRAKMAEGEGLAYGQAIPQLWSQAGSQYQNALNSARSGELSALQSAMQGRLGSNQFITQPGWLDRVSQVAGVAGQIGGLAMGIPGLGGRMGSGGGYGVPNANQTSGGGFWGS